MANQSQYGNGKKWATALVVGLCALTASPQAQTAATLEAKPANVKRIGVFVSGESADAVKSELLSLLSGDDTVLQVVALNQRLDALRLSEATKQHCDFILEASFEVKKGGGAFGMLGKAVEKAKSINKETEGLGNSKREIDNDDKRGTSVGNITKVLGGDGDSRISASYRVVSVASNRLMVKDDKSLKSDELARFIEGMLNSALGKILQ